jgi:hypothetical protein
MQPLDDSGDGDNSHDDLLLRVDLSIVMRCPSVGLFSIRSPDQQTAGSSSQHRVPASQTETFHLVDRYDACVA